MDGLNAWVLTLCACAAVVSIAETLLPESAVKKTAYLILSLVTAACLVRPIESLGDLSFDIETPSDTAPYTDWLSKMTQEEFSSNVTALIKDVLREINVTSQNIEVHTSISDDGSVYIDKARITVDERYKERLDEIEDAVFRSLGIETDVVVRGEGT